LPEAPTTTRRRGDPWAIRRPRHIRRAQVAAVVLAAVVLVALLVRSVLADSDAEALAERFGAAWAAEDFTEMYGMVDPATREDVPEEEFAAAYADAATTATATAIQPEGAREEDEGVVILPVAVETAIFGVVSGDVELPTTGEGEDMSIGWAPHLAFPGLGEDEELRRRTRAPERAALLARDGTVLAEGEADERSTELAVDAGSAAGTMAPAATEEARDALFARGFPEDALVGTTGLELIFEEEIAGRPGGVLLAGDRELARSEPQAAEPVRTTVDAEIQEAAALALAGLGGIAALDARSAEVRALAGQSITGPQPPGSTFKIVTTSAALEEGIVTPDEEFPVETAALIDGVEIDNAHGEACGGSFSASFAHSCNSVFAPLGVEVGAERLVETSERFGINGEASIPRVDASTMPEPDEIVSDLELGATAIGQGRLLVTPLQLASITQTIANDGKRVEPRVAEDAPPERERVTSQSVANTIEDLMVGVVASGTGTSAAIDGVPVAGKTGTAELGEGIEEHAWFTAFAPADKSPELAIAVMIANGGAGGEVAAPVARTVLEAGL
jgi:cell division protein FtsI/penicillin-binding protein 2